MLRVDYMLSVNPQIPSVVFICVKTGKSLLEEKLSIEFVHIYIS